MNKQRRKDLFKATVALMAAQEALDDAKAIVEQAHGEEEEYYETMPENFQFGDKGEVAQAAIDAMQEALDAFDEIDLGQVEDCINTATE